MRSLLALALAACTTEDVIETTTGETPKEIAERVCRENDWQCELVYAFETLADNPLGRVEMCVRKEDLPLAESMYGKSELSPHERFGTAYSLGIGPMCIWCAGFGCNAYLGCFNCPVPEMPMTFDVPTLFGVEP